MLWDEDTAVCLKDVDEDCVERPFTLAKGRIEALLDRPLEADGVCDEKLLIDERGRGDREGT